MTFLAFVVPLPYYIEFQVFRKIFASPPVNDTEDKKLVPINSLRLCYATLYIVAVVGLYTDIRSAQETAGGSSDVEFMRQFCMQTSQVAKYQGLKHWQGY